MSYWFTADSHFGHENIIKYCKRPFKSVTHMNEELIKRWNARVSPEDIVFHLGDFVITGKHKQFEERLNGKIIWIRGNHDKKSIIEDILIEYGGHFWHLIHRPEDASGEYNLVGHVHELWKVKSEEGKIMVNVGVDKWDFAPVSIKQILEVVKNVQLTKKKE